MCLLLPKLCDIHEQDRWGEVRSMYACLNGSISHEKTWSKERVRRCWLLMALAVMLRARRGDSVPLRAHQPIATKGSSQAYEHMVATRSFRPLSRFHEFHNVWYLRCISSSCRGNAAAYSGYKMVDDRLNVVLGWQILAHVLYSCFDIDALSKRLDPRLEATSAVQVSGIFRQKREERTGAPAPS